MAVYHRESFAVVTPDLVVVVIAHIDWTSFELAVVDLLVAGAGLVVAGVEEAVDVVAVFEFVAAFVRQ